MVPYNGLSIFTGNANYRLAEEIAAVLYARLGQMDVSTFPDGEIKVRIGEDVRGRDVFVIQPTCPDVNKNLMELLVIIDALRRASAERITAVMPYFGYARQDRKHAGRVPITAKLVANMITGAGADRVVTMDLHSTQIQGFFDIPLDHLSARNTILGCLKELDLERPVVASTDVGGMKMARDYSNLLSGEIAVVEKQRLDDAEVTKGYVVGEMKDRNVVIVDDMITTAGSLCQAAMLAREAGAQTVTCAASHGLFCGPAWERLSQAPIDRLIVTDSVPVDGRTAEKHGLNLVVRSVARYLAEAIRSIHQNESVSKLFEYETRRLS